MQFWSLPGLTSYAAARDLQLRLLDRRVADEIPDTVLFLEHSPVITRGRGLQFTGAARPRHMPLPGLIPAGVEFAESERGGDLTYHGPGQLVIYPIVKLDGQGFGPHHDIAGFLRKLEQVLVDTVAGLSQGRAEGLTRENATGVWVRRPGDPEIQARKIASAGIAIRRWVTYHGFALNCVNDLQPFHLISPCGFSPEVMTRLGDWLEPDSAAHRELADWAGGGRRRVEASIAERMVGVTSDILNVNVDATLSVDSRAFAPTDSLLAAAASERS